ncbi:hypothetical protein TRFO_18848 [Tritrichomonas foetus]|uniref:DUF3447 domain-containing protein n=1 Tax=Tritrichomonas foetus TaxID=1144522 RepID=A0A1J4KPG4_9EUKA|nr:hypothetical protein TRFO_18848 [Tritrichomonas foetus]|eukprot:OHT11598.1 hypothetical protein TRFO_18848 [Tritrichomonas foetus]
MEFDYLDQNIEKCSNSIMCHFFIFLMEDITQIYSKEILDEAELVSNLQDNLKDLDKDGIDDFLNYFLKSKFSSEDRFHQFFQNLHVCLRERPLSIFIYADTIYRIFCELKEPLNQKFKDEFTFAVHYRISEIDVAFDEPQLVFIINLLLERSFYTKEEIVEICKKLIKTKSLIVTQISVMFFFAPEMIELQQKLFDRFMKECNNLNLSSWFIFDRYSMAKKLYYDTNDWGKWREIRKTLHFGNPLFKSLIEDDVELLKLLSSHPNFSPNDTIKIPFMAPFDYLHQDPPILGVSAFFGSVKCFRHLSMLGADFEASDIIHHTPAQFATAGGNLEIIRFIEQHQCDFSGCLQVAAGFSRYDFFEYLHETKYPDISVLDEWRANVIGHATIENNPKILLRCIEEGVDVNIIDSSNVFF